MSKFADFAAGIAGKAKETAESLTQGAAALAKDAADVANEKRVVMQAEKKRAASKSIALVAFNDAIKDLTSLNKNLTSSESVKEETENLISELDKLKEMISQMTPETIVPILVEQRENWLDEKRIILDGDNYAQQELDKSEIYKRRKLAMKKCDKAIDALKKQADAEKVENE